MPEVVEHVALGRPEEVGSHQHQPRGAAFLGVTAEVDGGAGAIVPGSSVDGHLAVEFVENPLQGLLALAFGHGNDFAGAAQRGEAMHPGIRQESHVGANALLVQGFVVAKAGKGGGIDSDGLVRLTQLDASVSTHACFAPSGEKIPVCCHSSRRPEPERSPHDRVRGLAKSINSRAPIRQAVLPKGLAPRKQGDAG